MSKEKKKKSSSFTTWLLVLLMLAGLSLLLYPTVANWWNTLYLTREVKSYSDSVAKMDTSELDEMWNEAVNYNKELFSPNQRLAAISDEQLERYNNTLNVTASGIMGYVEIPRIRVELPIYHGTGDEILQFAIGHLDATTLPVGGINTHCVISGHRGLPSARLFTDIDQLVEGDTFILQVLGRTMTYEVDQIRVVLPTELANLEIEENMDYCTLVTCTPYGVNSHRLLVRGRRTDNAADEIYVPADATQIRPIYIAPIIGIPILFGLLIYVLIFTGKRRKRNK